jgi:predicted DNA-binding transcriptional regulator YafY
MDEIVKTVIKKTNSIEWLFSILMKYGQYAEIKKPKKVQQIFYNLIDSMLKMYHY